MKAAYALTDAVLAHTKMDELGGLHPEHSSSLRTTQNYSPCTSPFAKKRSKLHNLGAAPTVSSAYSALAYQNRNQSVPWALTGEALGLNLRGCTAASRGDYFLPRFLRLANFCVSPFHAR
jgi:hypothetical protein